jgi:hypothetical protein
MREFCGGGEFIKRNMLGEGVVKNILKRKEVIKK